MNEVVSPTRGVYAWVSRHPQVIDRAIAFSILLLTAVPYVATAAIDFASGSADAWSAVPLALVALALSIPLFWRRTHPVPAAAVMVVTCLTQLVFGLELVATQIAVLFIIQALAAYAPRWASWWGLGMGVGGILAQTSVVWAHQTDRDGVLGGVLLGAFGCSLVGIAWLLGDLTRSRRLEREALSDRAERLEREREREVRLAAADERARIAREMHDIVAHSLSVIVTQADGARYAAPPTAGPVLPALEAIAETARGSLTDMRRLLGVLREDDDAPTRPAAGLADLASLVRTVRTSGLDVELTTRGDRLRPPLPQGAELVVFRTVQEALTNVLKHAGTGVRAEVLLDWRRDEVVVRVSDDGKGFDPDAASTDGHGLQGMRERLGLYDGGVEISTTPGGGATVTATLPYPRTAPSFATAPTILPAAKADVP